MNDILNHYQLNNLLKEILYNSFSFIKNNTLFEKNNDKKPNINNPESKKEVELYEKYLNSINSKIDDYLDTR